MRRSFRRTRAACPPAGAPAPQEGREVAGKRRRRAAAPLPCAGLGRKRVLRAARFGSRSPALCPTRPAAPRRGAPPLRDRCAAIKKRQPRACKAKADGGAGRRTRRASAPHAPRPVRHTRHARHARGEAPPRRPGRTGNERPPPPRPRPTRGPPLPDGRGGPLASCSALRCARASRLGDDAPGALLHLGLRALHVDVRPLAVAVHHFPVRHGEHHVGAVACEHRVHERVRHGTP